MDYYERTDYVDMLVREREVSPYNKRGLYVDGGVPETPLSTGRLSRERAHGEILTRVLFFQLRVTEAGKPVSACITFANFVDLTLTYVTPSRQLQTITDLSDTVII